MKGHWRRKRRGLVERLKGISLQSATQFAQRPFVKAKTAGRTAETARPFWLQVFDGNFLLWEHNSERV
jgi:hypothetical protein